MTRLCAKLGSLHANLTPPNLHPSIRAWVSTGAKGAWHPQNVWTVMSGTRWFWQFYNIMVCCTLKLWEFTSDWHLLFQIPNSSPEYWGTSSICTYIDLSLSAYLCTDCRGKIWYIQYGCIKYLSKFSYTRGNIFLISCKTFMYTDLQRAVWQSFFFFCFFM